MSSYKNCQSCGMPFNKDSEGGGSNSDGTKSTVYCSYCYQQGAFTQPDITATEMQVFVKQVLKDKGLPGFMASLFTRGIPKLARWSSH